MVNWPVRVPVLVGEKVAGIVQFAPALMLAPTQLSGSAKSPVALIEVGRRANALVFVTLTDCGLLVLPSGCASKVSDVGIAVAVVICTPAVSKGICHMPRP